MPSRQLQILISKTLPLVPDNVLIIGDGGIAFSKATNLLGQEFEHILFDGRNGIHLEALAIAAGTLKMSQQSPRLILFIISNSALNTIISPF